MRRRSRGRDEASGGCPDDAIGRLYTVDALKKKRVMPALQVYIVVQSSAVHGDLTPIDAVPGGTRQKRYNYLDFCVDVCMHAYGRLQLICPIGWPAGSCSNVGNCS